MDARRKDEPERVSRIPIRGWNALREVLRVIEAANLCLWRCSFLLLKKLHPCLSLGTHCCDQHSVTPERGWAGGADARCFVNSPGKTLLLYAVDTAHPHQKSLGAVRVLTHDAQSRSAKPQEKIEAQQYQRLHIHSMKATQDSSNLTAGTKPISAGFSPDINLAPTHH